LAWGWSQKALDWGDGLGSEALSVVGSAPAASLKVLEVGEGQCASPPSSVGLWFMLCTSFRRLLAIGGYE
jgi:hypothetical protein